jgi:hypothetical protein
MKITKKEKNFAFFAVAAIAGEHLAAKKPIKYDNWKSVLQTVAIGLVGGVMGVVKEDINTFIRNS